MLHYLITSFHNIKGTLLDFFYKQKVKKLSNGDYFLKKEIPSFTQWESKNLVDRIVKGEIDTKEDKLWKEGWAISKEEYEMYSWQICWITCFKMILKSIYKEKNYKLVELAKEAEKYWVYKTNGNSNTKVNLDWLFHKEFLLFIKKYWLKWQYKLWVKENYLASLLMENKYIIASVHHFIREEQILPNPKKWHLVLVVGFRIKNWKIKGFFINNPSGYFKKSQERHFVSLENWKKVFSRNVDNINLELK